MFSKDTSFLTTNGWRAYKAIPFIWEMKVIIDWTVTSTCLDLFSGLSWMMLITLYITMNSSQSQESRDPSSYKDPFGKKCFKDFALHLDSFLSY